MKSYNTTNSLGHVIRAIHCDECLCNKSQYPRSDYSQCERQPHFNGCFGGVPNPQVDKELRRLECEQS
jgi:hypothetical protein